MLGTAIFSVLLRVTWLVGGRGYGIPRAIGRTVFDHILSAFIALVLVAQGSLTPPIQALTRQVNQQCEILPRPVLLRSVHLNEATSSDDGVMIVAEAFGFHRRLRAPGHGAVGFFRNFAEAESVAAEALFDGDVEEGGFALAAAVCDDFDERAAVFGGEIGRVDVGNRRA